MPVEMRGRMDRPNTHSNGGGSFGLRFSKQDDDAPDGWANCWVNVYVPPSAKGIELVHDGNAKAKVEIVEGFCVPDHYNGETKLKVICQNLILLDSGPEYSAPPPPSDEVPF